MIFIVLRMTTCGTKYPLPSRNWTARDQIDGGGGRSLGDFIKRCSAICAPPVMTDSDSHDGTGWPRCLNVMKYISTILIFRSVHCFFD